MYPRAGGGARAAGGGRAPTLGSGSRPFGPKPPPLSGSWPVGQITWAPGPGPNPARVSHLGPSAAYPHCTKESFKSCKGAPSPSHEAEFELGLETHYLMG